MQETLGAAREIAAVDPASLIYQETVTNALSNLCAALIGLERHADALLVARENIEKIEWALAKGATDARTKTNLAMAFTTLSAILSKLARHDEAITAGRRAVALQQEVSDADFVDLKKRDDLGYARANLAWVLRDVREFIESEANFRMAIAIADEVLAKESDNPQLARQAERANWQTGLARVLFEKGGCFVVESVWAPNLTSCHLRPWLAA